MAYYVDHVYARSEFEILKKRKIKNYQIRYVRAGILNNSNAWPIVHTIFGASKC